jgi:hypothetical protein
MTAIASIVVKKADNTTNITWSGVNGAAGNSPALWRSTSASGTVGQQPTLSLSGKWNADQTVRRLDGKVIFPSVYTDTNSSLTKIRSTMNMSFSIAVPQDVAATDLAEFAAQATALLHDAMITGSINSGFAPT